MNPIKIKVLEGHPSLVGKILHLSKREHSTWWCEKHHITIIDTDDEVEFMGMLKNEGKDDTFYRLLLFTDSFDGLRWIDTAKYITR